MNLPIGHAWPGGCSWGWGALGLGGIQENPEEPLFPLDIAAAHRSLQCRALSAGVSAWDNAMKSYQLGSQSSAPPAARGIAVLPLFSQEIGRVSGEELSLPWMT